MVGVLGVACGCASASPGRSRCADPVPTGLAERAHVRSAEPITFSTHVQDVVDLLYFDDLVDVIMVGWSYGGAVADGVADLVPERLREVVNLDGEILREGHPLLDGWTEEAR